MIRQAAASPALAPVRAAEIAPGPGVRASALVRAWIRGTVASYYHPAGACRSEPTPIRARWWTPSCGSTGSPGCGSPTHRCSRFIPNAPLHATVLAIAEKAADLIGSQ